MQNISKHILRLLPLLGLLTLAGCPSDRMMDEPPGGADNQLYDLTFEAPDFIGGRTLDTILAADMDNDSRVEYIVASIGDTSVSALGRADLLEIYRFDTVSGYYHTIITDTLFWASAYKFLDCTGDGIPELIVPITSGGNDPVASEGLAVYSGDGGSLRTLYHSAEGKPVIDRIGETETLGIFVYNTLRAGFASRAEAIIYLDSVFSYQKGKLASVSETRPEYFKNLAESYLAEYAGMRTGKTPGDDNGEALFRTATLSIIALERAGEASSLRSFWSSEREFLRKHLSEIQHATLEEVYARTLVP